MTTTSVLSLHLDPEDYPTDPAELGPCPEASGNELIFLNMPAQLFPSDVPDGLTVSHAYSGDSLEGVPSDGLGPGVEWSEHLVVTDADGRVIGELAITSSASDPWTGGALYAATIRGQRATMKPNENRGGPTGWTDAYWSEDGHGFSVESIGFSDDELRSLLNRVELSPEGLSDPAGETTKVGEPGFVGTPGTGIVLTASTDSIPAANLSIDHTNGQDRGIHYVADMFHFSPSLLGMQLGQLNGRPAFWGPSPSSGTPWFDSGEEDVNRVVTSTAEGHAVTAIGLADIDQLKRLVASIEPIEPGDARLVGVPIGRLDDVGQDGIWCRPDR